MHSHFLESLKRGRGATACLVVLPSLFITEAGLHNLMMVRDTNIIVLIINWDVIEG